MIRSMTGFGRAGFSVADVAFEVEVRTVNHRHLDARIRLPRSLAALEAEVKRQVQGVMVRGKVDLNVAYAGQSGATQLEVDAQVASEYITAGRQIGAAHGLDPDVDVAALLALPGVARFGEPGLPEEEVLEALGAGVASALAAADAMREAEGKALARELEGRLETVLSLVAFFEERSQIVGDSIREKLKKRSEQLAAETGLVDDARLHQEIVIAADRLDITEELVRLRSHVDQFRAILGESQSGVAVGRRLDFLLQEMGREANTIGSKGNDAPIAHQVVELKTELERIREQVQNVE